MSNENFTLDAAYAYATKYSADYDELCDLVGSACAALRAENESLRAQLAQRVPDGWLEFIQRVAEQKPEKPDYWSSCGQCERNASEAEDLLSAAPAQPTEQPAKDCEWTNCPNRVGDVCCNEQQEAQGEQLASAQIEEIGTFSGYVKWLPHHGGPLKVGDYIFSHPQQASKPMTDEQIRALCKQEWVFETVRQWVRIVERFHTIGEKK